MAFITADWVRESSTTTGTGDISLGGAKSPGQAFSAVCADGDQFEYNISHDTLNEFETGLGTYETTGNLLLRTAVFTSSNSNNAVNFSAGNKTVELIQSSKRISSTGTTGASISSSSATIALSDGDVFSLAAFTTDISGLTFTVARPGRSAWVKFLTARNLVHSSTFNLPTSANITTAAGDYMLLIFRGSTQYDVPVYYRANGQALVQPSIAAQSVLVNATGSTAVPAALSVGTNTVVGRVAGNVIAAGLVNAQVDAAAALALSKFESIGAGTVVGKQIDGSTSAPVALTGAEVAELLRIGTVQSETGSLPLAVTLGADVTFLNINIAGDGNIETVTGSTLGRVVLVAIASTGTKTIKHNASAGTSSAFINPGLVDFQVTVRDSFLLVGLGTVGWQVVSAPLGINRVGNTQLRDSAACSLIGRSANSSGDPADITASTNDRILARESDALSFTQVSSAMIANGVFATQSDQETATSTTTIVTPGRQHFHPSAAKFWCKVSGDGSGTISAYNVSSITDNGTGDMTVNTSITFSSADWAATVCVAGATTSVTTANCDAARLRGANQTANSVRFQNYDFSPSLQDPFMWHVAGFGDI